MPGGELSVAAVAMTNGPERMLSLLRWSARKAREACGVRVLVRLFTPCPKVGQKSLRHSLAAARSSARKMAVRCRLIGGSFGWSFGRFTLHAEFSRFLRG